MAQGTFVLNSNKGTKERVGRLLLMHANSREDIDVARTGDIVAVAGLKNIVTGETLCDEKKPVILERMDVRTPSSLPKPRSTEMVITTKSPGMFKLMQTWRVDCSPPSPCMLGDECLQIFDPTALRWQTCGDDHGLKTAMIA